MISIASAIRLAAVSLFFLAVFGIAHTIETTKAADDPFIGTWKLDRSKSRLTDEMKVASLGGNKYGFDFGSGNSENIVADGTDQPGNFGSTLSVAVVDANTWQVIRKKDGRTIISATWKLSEDGNTLTDQFKSHKPDGSTSGKDYVYKRAAGSAGFAGTWATTNDEMTAFELQIKAYEANGLSFNNSAEGTTRNVKFDGQDYKIVGANLPAGFTFTSSGRRLNARALELTDKVDGKVMDTQHVELSSDLKTLTITVQRPIQGKPNVLVFSRE